MAAPGHREIVELLLNDGADLNIQSKSGWTALMWAASEGRKEIVELLLNDGANSDIQNKYGRTTLYLTRDLGLSIY